MGILRIMSVGKTGVGKSTIGNMLLSGNGQGAFKTSQSTESCTKDSKMVTSDCGGYAYVDVPGIPDTEPQKTASFYDVVIQEAKRELNVILFVFKRERVDPAAYKLAQLLFREINKSNAVKVLVINDQNSYTLSSPPAEAEYEAQARSIADITKVDFAFNIFFTAETMRGRLEQLKKILSKTRSHTSEHLKSFSELHEYVEDLRKKKNYQEQVIAEGRRRMSVIQSLILDYQKILAGAATTAAVATVAAVFTFGATLAIATPSAAAVAAAYVAIEIQKALLKKEKEKINTKNLEKAARELEEACKQFHELESALIIDVS